MLLNAACCGLLLLRGLRRCLQRRHRAGGMEARRIPNGGKTEQLARAGGRPLHRPGPCATQVTARGLRGIDCLPMRAMNGPCRERNSLTARCRPYAAREKKRGCAGSTLIRVHGNYCETRTICLAGKTAAERKGSADVVPVRQRNYSKIDNCYCPRRQPLLLRRANFSHAHCRKSTRFAPLVKCRANAATRPLHGHCTGMAVARDDAPETPAFIRPCLQAIRKLSRSRGGDACGD
ncbi:hypothetical protein LMG28688_06465 [Paraburkholderia caffeinitolerans]|uniref:Uncharacterized protein n=1 Tax=Paraburkholderia caffeinitolerans TaxID=1723730 RepID=A0A6J5GVG8_9BURK|nr:hypothetical protein LMG28688_06465 [Paraburkholderia caffeinitolerans]